MNCSGVRVLTVELLWKVSLRLLQKLTNFIQDWSDLQLNWQNWFDELHVGVEESKNLSEQLKKFDCDIESLIPTSAKLFPVTVAMKALDKELRRVQVKR